METETGAPRMTATSRRTIAAILVYIPAIVALWALVMNTWLIGVPVRIMAWAVLSKAGVPSAYLEAWTPFAVLIVLAIFLCPFLLSYIRRSRAWLLVGIGLCAAYFIAFAGLLVCICACHMD
jgi:hypothetical protein